MTERVRLRIWDLDDTFWRGAKSTRRAPAHYTAFNQAMRWVAADFVHVEVIEVDDILEDGEIQDRLHFRRPGLFKIYRRTRDSVWG